MTEQVPEGLTEADVAGRLWTSLGKRGDTASEVDRWDGEHTAPPAERASGVVDTLPQWVITLVHGEAVAGRLRVS